jgi:protein farnesyltransferase/geranylgeranyltransferase type-1 subunit alpha
VRLNASCEHEFEFLKNVLDEESKNYHAWLHLQWLLNHFKNHFSSKNLFNSQDDLTRSLIALDNCNNSAWAHRFFVFTKFQHPLPFNETPETQLIFKTDFQLEKKFALDVIRRAPLNQSPWSYIRGHDVLFN